MTRFEPVRNRSDLVPLALYIHTCDAVAWIGDKCLPEPSPCEECDGPNRAEDWQPLYRAVAARGEEDRP